MELTKEQAQIMRQKRQEISKKLIDVLCVPAEDDYEYFLNLLIAQQEIATRLSEFSDIAFCDWVERKF